MARSDYWPERMLFYSYTSCLGSDVYNAQKCSRITSNLELPPPNMLISRNCFQNASISGITAGSMSRVDRRC